MSEIVVNVTVPPSTSIERACRAACRVADQLGVSVLFDFNGSRLAALPGSDPDYMVARFYMDRRGVAPGAPAPHTHLPQQGRARRAIEEWKRSSRDAAQIVYAYPGLFETLVACVQNELDQAVIETCPECLRAGIRAR